MLNKIKENLLRSILWLEEASLFQSDIANQKKQQLLTMARKGQPRPNNKKHPLGSALSSYTNPKTTSYDSIFDKEIRELAPQWFISLSDIANEKKQQLLQMARNGEPKPNKIHPLGRVLGNYTNPKNECYDPNFDKEIRELAPEWFIDQSDIANQKKQQLLEMARKGEPRPNKKHPLGLVLGNYTNPKNNSYDPVFDKEIRELAPEWFVSRSDIANQKKQQLLTMARKGEPRPNKKHPLGLVLGTYTNPKSKCYDPVFDKEIRKIAPEWFVFSSDIANQKKQQLLQMAIKGEPRPHQTKHPLGSALSTYTNPKSDCYDSIFDKEIRELAPKWFTIAQKHGKIKYLNSGKKLSSKLREKNVGCTSAK